MYKKEYVETFLKNQDQLFDEPVAEDFEEAEAFLEDCMAVVLDSIKDVKNTWTEWELTWRDFPLKSLRKRAKYSNFRMVNILLWKADQFFVKRELHFRKLNMINLHQQTESSAYELEIRGEKNDVKEEGI